MTATEHNRKYTLADLEALAPISPASTNGGRRRRMGCPFHGSDHQRSLEVILETGHFSCHNCGEWGYLKDSPGNTAWKPSGPGRRPPNVNKANWGAFLKKPSLQEARTASKPTPAVPQAPVIYPLEPAAQSRKMNLHMEAARRHLEDPEALAYLKARHIPLELAREYGLGYFPPGKWEGRKAAARWGRIAFSLENPAGELVGLYSRAVDADYPREKAPKETRHDVWGKRDLFHPDALEGPSLFLTEGPFDALAMLGNGWPAAALVGTNKLPWEALGNVRELYLCLDLDVTGEGQKAARKLAREAVLRGIPVHIMEDGAYGGYSEPSDQWEAEGRVTLDGAELELCQECKAPVHYYDPDGAPYCETHGPGL